MTLLERVRIAQTQPLEAAFLLSQMLVASFDLVSADGRRKCLD
jgi:hypothetical protein